MKQHSTTPFALAWALTLSLSPVIATAQTAYGELAKTVVVGDAVHIFGLPTVSADGKRTNYLDVTIQLQLNANGVVLPSAPVVAVKSPSVRSSEFIVAAYADASVSANCTLQASSFNGRVQYDFNCVDVNFSDTLFSATWYTGSIDGHPLERELKAAKLNELPGNQDYAWGRVMHTTGRGGAWWGCFNTPDLLSARQVGDVITLVDYGPSDNMFDCQMTFNRKTIL